MALLNIRPANWPKDATHSSNGRLIKDIGEVWTYNPNRPHAKKEPTEVYYIWNMGEWVMQFGRHLGQALIQEENNGRN